MMDAKSTAPDGREEPSVATMEALLAEMRLIKRNGRAMAAFAMVLTGLLCVLAAGFAEDSAKWIFGALAFGIIVVMGIVGWVRGQHERKAMPTIAQLFGLAYQKSPKDFFQDIPNNFIPLGGRRSVDDLMSGKVADRSFHFAECKRETGGKNSRTLFKGVVLVVESKGGLPSFIVAAEKETKGFLFSKGRVQVDEIPLIYHSAAHDGQTYGLWSHSPEAKEMAGLRSFMERIIAVGPKILGQSTLYSVVSTGGHYYVSLRHSRDLFKIGGLLADDAQMRADMQTAAAEFSHPIDLIAEILRAEDAFLRNGMA